MLFMFLPGIVASSPAQSPLPAGPGRQVLDRMCTRCHGLSVVTAQRMTARRWSNEVQAMISRGAVGSDADVQALVQYLAANFGPESSSPREQAGQEPDASVGAAALQAEWAPANTGVTFNRLLHADREPQNWLTYGGAYSSQRYSLLKQITPQNATDSGIEMGLSSPLYGIL